MRIHADRKAVRFIDICERFAPKQVNVNHCAVPFQKPEWHAHLRQQDVFFCIKGSFLIGLAVPVKKDPKGFGNGSFDASEWIVNFETLTERNPRTLFIPTGTFHTYVALEPNSTILFGMKEKYDAKDLFVLPAGFFGEDWNLK